MEIFKNDYGYAPLLVNLEGHFDKPFDKLPDELKLRVKRAFFAIPWDDLDIPRRRRRAADYDYLNDPNHEPVTYFELLAFSADLKDWIEKARRESKDAAVVALLDLTRFRGRLVS